MNLENFSGFACWLLTGGQKDDECDIYGDYDDYDDFFGSYGTIGNDFGRLSTTTSDDFRRHHQQGLLRKLFFLSLSFSAGVMEK